jgi:hypothetical protein
MEDARPRLTRPRFYDLCLIYQFDIRRLQDMGNRAGVPDAVVHALFVGEPVERSDAEKVLVVVSELTGKPWNLDNTTLPLKGEIKRLFFAELWRKHHFRVDLIASLAHVSEETIHAMLRNDPVRSADASAVLAMLSRVLKQEYSLETVHVPLLPEEVPDATGE